MGQQHPELRVAVPRIRVLGEVVPVAEDTNIPTSYCPFSMQRCRRLECALWVEDMESLGCAFFFCGAEAQRQNREASS